MYETVVVKELADACKSISTIRLVLDRVRKSLGLGKMEGEASVFRRDLVSRSDTSRFANAEDAIAM
jgi:hypothetical protein